VTDRLQIARDIVRRHMWWSAGGALVPIPFVDMAAITGAQLKMLAELSKTYDVPFEQVRVKAVIGALLGYVLHPPFSSGLVGSALLKAIPGLGVLFGTPALVLFTAAFTWALGRVFIQHFESGGTFLDFDPETVREGLRAHFAEGRELAP
jgi:uncharacterized protein (DUF697 family)